MRSTARTVFALAAALALVVLFLRNVDLRAVSGDIAHARPGWLAVSFTTFVLIIAIRARRWQVLLRPLGRASFANSFRATAVGFAASTLLPARAGELIRPYFLSKHERVSATGAFATIVLERLLDVVAVLVLLALFVFIFGREQAAAGSSAFTAIRWAGMVAGAAAAGVLAILFLLAGRPTGLDPLLARLEFVMPAKSARFLARLVEKFSTGLAVVRRPGQLLAALLWSFPLWLTIGAGIWSIAKAFGLFVPFTGSFLMISLLVIGGAVPTPGAIGGFHEAFRFGATTFFGASNESAVGAAIVLHAFSVLPTLVLGGVFAAQAGLNFGAMRQLASQPESGPA
jgi:glycosyltransferase 2 family protein